MEQEKTVKEGQTPLFKVLQYLKVKTAAAWLIGLGGFLALLWLPEAAWPIRAALAVTFLGLILWIFEIFSLGLTAVMILIFYVVFQAASVDQALSGFATGATFLVVAGMMIAQGVHKTSIGLRVVYGLLKLTGSSPGALLLGIILIPQVLSLFIPATAVRTSLALPVILSLIETLRLNKEVHYKKQMMLSLAYGSNISGVGFLPAAISNVLVVEILYIYTGTTISYFEWLLYTGPIWLTLIPVTWFVVYKVYPIKVTQLGNIRTELDTKLKELGPLTARDIRCLIILAVTVLLWMTQGIHGLHPAVPALAAVVLMGIPKIGIATWDQLSKINVETFLIIGVTISIGTVLIDSGAIDFLTGMLFTDLLLSVFAHPLLAILAIVVIVQIYHLGVTNVATAVITITPVFIAVAHQVAVDPIPFALLTGITSLLGFILVVETLPNVLAHGTKLVSQRDFYLPGLALTVLTTVCIALVVMSWWRWLGLY